MEGTIFWRFDLDETTRELEQLDGNLILIQRLYDVGWNALDDVERAYAAAIITDDDELIICESNFEPILIDGELVEPEEALQQYDVRDLEEAGYVRDATASAVQKFITPYEMSTRFDLGEVVKELIDEDYSFQEIVDDAKDADLID